MSYSPEYIIDINFRDATQTFEFIAPANMRFIAKEDQPGLTSNITGYTIGNTINKYSSFTVSVDATGLVTLIGYIL